MKVRTEQPNNGNIKVTVEFPSVLKLHCILFIKDKLTDLHSSEGTFSVFPYFIAKEVFPINNRLQVIPNCIKLYFRENFRIFPEDMMLHNSLSFALNDFKMFYIRLGTVVKVLE